MSLQYRVYRNDAAGGPVDLSSPVATVSGLTWTAPALTPPADVTYLVRAYDTVSGLEDDNGDARVRVVLDASGNDLTARPAPPSGLSVRATAGGTARVSWTHALARMPAPTGFKVYVGAGSVSYASPAGTVAYSPGNPGKTYGFTLTGLTGGTLYRVGVRAYNGAGEEPNTESVPVTALSSGPSAVVSLAVTAIP